MVLYDDNVSLTKNTIITNFNVEFITAFFNDNTQKTLYIIAIYKPPKILPTCQTLDEYNSFDTCLLNDK
jgi:hypothetical protein